MALLAFMVGSLGTASLAWSQAVATPGVVYNPPSLDITKAQIKTRIQAQTAKANADSKVGKLTTEQTSDLLVSLQAIKDQVKADYAENGKKELTEDQKVSLSAMLDQTGSAIHVKSGPKDFKN